MRRKNGLVCINALFTMNKRLISASEKEQENYYKDNPGARDRAKIKVEVQRLKEQEESTAKRFGRQPFTQPVLAVLPSPCRL